jgi:hypothetical protein
MAAAAAAEQIAYHKWLVASNRPTPTAIGPSLDEVGMMKIAGNRLLAI